MKFAFPLVLLAAGVATAQSATGPASSSNTGNSVCDAEYIVDVCLNSELKKLEDCSQTDYDCLCAASEAVATCFNNCPSDPRAGTYRSQVQMHCANASAFGTRAQASQTSAISASGSQAFPSATGATPSGTSTSTGGDDDDNENDGGVAATGSSSPGASETADGTTTAAANALVQNSLGFLLALGGAVLGAF